MPELPEVETVRRGLLRTAGRRVAAVQVRHPRAVRRQPGGAEELVVRTTGATLLGAHRRGKVLWLPLSTGDVLLAWLGMTGQLLLTSQDSPDGDHLRVRLSLGDGAGAADGGDGSDGEDELRFVDARTFGGLAAVPGSPDGPDRPPPAVAHVAPDPLDRDFDDEAVVAGVRRRRTSLKSALLDQTLLSGVGNIYADEALWRAGLSGQRPTATATRPEVRRLLSAVREVLLEAVGSGGTSFDTAYVDVDGRPGGHGPRLAVYGREGLPCPRCGTAVRRDPFTNRSSATCPRCQPRPRRPHGSAPPAAAPPARARAAGPAAAAPAATDRAADPGPG